MAKSTHRITYHYEVDGRDIAISRIHTGTAYARNGNVGNPTEYFTWESRKDGEYVGQFPTRTAGYEVALGNGYCSDDGKIHGPNGRKSTIRNYTLVADEMKANYRRKVTA